nr:succinate:cytochrome c oxidoreductase subunit 4 [Synarthrophyton patena]
MILFYKWWFLRFPIILLFSLVFLDNEIVFLLTSFLFLHLTLGLKIILNDYLHNKKILIIFLILIRLCNFECLRYILEFLF